MMDFIGHKNKVNSVAITNDCKKLVSGSKDKYIIVWDVESAKNIKQWIAHTDDVRSVVVTPNNKKIVSGSVDQSAKLWDFEGDLLHTFKGHSDRIFSIAMHPSGDFIATGSWDKTWKLWSLRTLKQLYTSRDTHTNGVKVVLFSADGNNLISGSTDATISIADMTPR